MIRVLEEARSVDFYSKVLGLAVSGRYEWPDFTLIYMKNAEADFEVELTAAPLDTAYLAPTADAPDDVVERRRAWLGG